MNLINETLVVSKIIVGNQDVKNKSFILKIFTMKEREGSGSSNFPEPQSKPAVDTQSISGIEL